MTRPDILPALLAAVTLLTGCDGASSGGTQGGPRDGATKVVTVQVESRPLIDQIEALGTANANESIEIRPRISSLIERIVFEEGQLVGAGDLLIELENSEIVAGFALAEASLSESRSLYDRNKSLSSSQAISASNLEQLLAQVKVDEARVEAARARLANTRIRAPFSGRVGLRRVSPGSYVDASTVITTLDDIGKIKLDFSVPETFLRAVKDGMDVVAHSIVFPDRKFVGTILSVDTRVDPVSRAVQVRALIENDDGALKPGMFMTVDLQQDQGEVLMAPEQAVVPEGTSQFVFVVADGVVSKRTVSLGRRIPGFVVIREGLVEGESIITEGTGKVRDGTEVESLDQASATTQQAVNEG